MRTSHLVPALGTAFLVAAIAAPGAAQCPVEDGFEPNDDCASATHLTPGNYSSYHDLRISTGNPDFYEFTVPPGNRLTVSLTEQTNQIYDLDMRIVVDGACGPASGFGAYDLDVSMTGGWTNEGSSSVDVVVEVFARHGVPCSDYRMAVWNRHDECFAGLADDNDTCADATPIGSGVFPDQGMRQGDSDYFEFIVPSFSTLRVELDDGQFVTENVEMYLYGDTACGGFLTYADYPGTIGYIMVLEWSNFSAAPRAVVGHVWTPVSDPCKSYEMRVTGAIDPVGATFCRGDGSADAGAGPVACPCANHTAPGKREGCLNSQGVGAGLFAVGSASVAADDLSFVLSHALPGQTGMLVQGMSRIAIPFKDGVLCMGPETRRMEALVTNQYGTAQTTGSIVTAGNLAPGRTRHYQAWYRDPGGVSPCGTGSNFSHGLTVEWN